MIKIGKFIGLLITLFGAAGFIGGGLISEGVIDYKGELPLGDIEGIYVDEEENIYLGLGFYGRVQVYDRDGKFVKNWIVPTSDESFNMKGTKDKNILIGNTRGNETNIYDLDGNLISVDKDTDHFEYSIKEPIFINTNGNQYRVKGWMFPVIMKSFPEARVIVKQGLLLQLLRGPVLTWLIGAFGILILYVFDEKLDSNLK